ncbi:MAG TPA: phytanoyl-CoA dioxygenase family protein [Planctomycetota bacterium]|nr:phytanoyl-CoA dioxygenase family protein [Planctomycetota bacterium]
MRTAAAELTIQQIEQYHRDGYIVVPDLLTREEVRAFLQHCDNRKEPIQFGLHGHLKDPQYKYLAHHPGIAGRAMQLLSGHPRIVQTMYLDKSPKGGKGIALHQDCMYLENDPPTLMACWVALTDTDKDNGGLCVVPGSHKNGARTWHKNENDKEHQKWEMQHDFRDRDGRVYKKTLHALEIDGIEREKPIHLRVPAGAGVFFTGCTIHGSYANVSPDRPRKAFAIHYVREGTWLFRTDVQQTAPVEL